MDFLRASLGRVFNLRPEDWKPLFLLQTLIVGICAVITSTKAVAASLFVAHIGVANLPYIYMASAATLVITGFGLIPLIDKFPRLLMYRITVLCLAALLGIAFLGILAHQSWVYYITYLVAALIDSLLFLEFWLIAADLCDARQTKRVFPLVIGWSLIGGMLGAFGTKVLVGFLHTEYLLLVSGGLLVSTLGLIQIIHKAFPKEVGRAPASKMNPSPQAISISTRCRRDLRIVQESPLVRLICCALLLYSLLAFLTDFMFNTVASGHFTVNGTIQVDRLTAFYGFFDGIAITVGLLFQFFFVNRILRNIGVTNSQLVLPAMFGLGFTSIFFGSWAGGTQSAFVPTLSTRLGHKFLSSSIHRSSATILYSPIPSEKRGRARAFAESVVQPTGVFLAGLLIFLVRGLPMVQVAAIAIALSTVYIFVMTRLRKAYLRQILMMFEEKNFGVLESFAGMFARLGEREILEKLCNSLADKDFNIRNFVVELLGEIKHKSAVPPLIELYEMEENLKVKATAIQVMGKIGKARIAPVLQDAMNSKDARLRANAIEAIVMSKNTNLYNLIVPALRDAQPRVSANAAIALWQLKIQTEIPKAIETLFERYGQDNQAYKLSALYAFGEIATGPCVEALIKASRDTNKKIVSRAIQSLGSTKSEQATLALIELLPTANSALQNLIANSLIKLAPHHPDLLLRSMHHPDIYSRRILIRVAGTMEDNRIQEALKAIALNEIDAVNRHRDWLKKIRTIPQKDVRRLFVDTFNHLNQQAKTNVLDILRVLAGNTPAMQRIVKDLSHPNRFIQASALDALETVGHKTIAKAFVPLLEGNEGVRKEGVGDADREDLMVWVRQWLKSPYRWIRACGIFTIGRLRLTDLHQELLSALNDSYDLVRANAVEALAAFGVGPNRMYIESMLKDPSPLPRRYAKELLQ